MRWRSGLKTIPAASTTPATPIPATPTPATPTTPTTPTPTTPARAAEVCSCTLNGDLLQVFVAQFDKINKLFGEFAIGSIHRLLSLSVCYLNRLLRRSMFLTSIYANRHL